MTPEKAHNEGKFKMIKWGGRKKFKKKKVNNTKK